MITSEVFDFFSVLPGFQAGLKKLFLFLVILLYLPGTGSASAGTIYYYKDKDGGLHFTDMPDNDNYKPYISFRESRKLSSRKFKSMVRKYSKKHGMEPNLVHAVIQTESAYQVDAVSSVGAQGLMQIMPETQKDLGLTDPFDPHENIDAGIRYLKQMLDRFKSVPLALAAYNAGPANVEKYGGIPPFKETRNYVKKVLELYERLKING